MRWMTDAHMPWADAHTQVAARRLRLSGRVSAAHAAARFHGTACRALRVILCCMSVYICMCMYIHVHTYTYTHMCIYTYRHIYIYIYIHA